MYTKRCHGSDNGVHGSCPFTVEEKARDAKKNIYNTMIPNPIYDGSGMDFKPGPVYDFIKPPQPGMYVH